MVELEDLTPFRFYKLRPIWKQRCTKSIYNKLCNGLLWMYRTNGLIKLRCNHVGCLSQYDVRRFCSNCDREYKFDDLTCSNCEPLVIECATYYLTEEEALKSIKKLNKHYKVGDLNQEDWENAVKLNKLERETCSRKLEKLKQENPIIERHLQTLIIQQ